LRLLFVFAVTFEPAKEELAALAVVSRRSVNRFPFRDDD